MSVEPAAATAKAIYAAGVDAARPEAPVARAIRAMGAPRGDVAVIAAGKAAAGMAEAAVAALGERGVRVTGGLVVGPDGHAVPPLQSARGDHPVPGAASRAAARLLERSAQAASRAARVLVLLSGGATSLLAAPAPGVTGEALPDLFEALLASGFDIARMNAIRRRFLQWGAGRLAVALGPAEVQVLALSDVAGNDPAVIASGPCAADRLPAADVRRLAERALPAGLLRRLLAGSRGTLPRIPGPDHPAFRRVRFRVLADNRSARQGAAREARARGLSARTLRLELSGPAAAAGAAFATRLLARGSGEQCLIAGGETTVRLEPGSGPGGRAQELALAAARVLDGHPGVAVLAAGTDGRDGPTDAAGAVVTGATWRTIRAAGLDPGELLARHASYPALDRAGALLRTGPTGTNVRDLVIGIRLEAGQG